MTTLVANTFSWVGLTGVATWFKRQNAKLEHARRVRSTIKELNKLSDRELNDIGLARGDIWAVAHEDADYKRFAETNNNLKGWV